MRLLLIGLIVAQAIAPETWRTIERKHFQLLYLDRSAALAPETAATIEAELERVALALSVKDLPAITVVLAPDQETFIARQGGAPDWASGTAYPERGLIYLRPLTGAEVRHNSLRAVIAHELSHVLLHQRLGGAQVPTWLDEGMAVFLANEDLMSRADHLVSIGLTGAYLPFGQLEDGFPAGGQAAAVAYAQSGDFVRFLYRQFGGPAMDDLLDRLARGEQSDGAFEAAFGQRRFELEKQWLKGVRLAYGLIPALSGGTLLWFLMSILFIVGYFRNRARSRRKLAAMAMEERGDFDPDPTRTFEAADEYDPADENEMEKEDDEGPPDRWLH